MCPLSRPSGFSPDLSLSLFQTPSFSAYPSLSASPKFLSSPLRLFSTSLSTPQPSLCLSFPLSSPLPRLPGGHSVLPSLRCLAPLPFRLHLSVSVSPVPVSGRRLPAPPPAAVGVTLQPAGLREQLTPRFLAPGWVPAAAKLCQPSARLLLPTRTSAALLAPLPARATSGAGLASQERGGGMPSSRCPGSRSRTPPPGRCQAVPPAAAPPRTHPAQRRPRRPAASPWLRCARCAPLPGRRY